MTTSGPQPPPMLSFVTAAIFVVFMVAVVLMIVFDFGEPSSWLLALYIVLLGLNMLISDWRARSMWIIGWRAGRSSTVLDLTHAMENDVTLAQWAHKALMEDDRFATPSNPIYSWWARRHKYDPPVVKVADSDELPWRYLGFNDGKHHWVADMPPAIGPADLAGFWFEPRRFKYMGVRFAFADGTVTREFG